MTKRATPSGPGHRLTVAERSDRTNPAFGKWHHIVCSCGFQTPWRQTLDEALQDGRDHERVPPLHNA